VPILHAIVLGIVQGLSEFLPISSSGHLRLVPWLFGWNDFSGGADIERTFDVALHLGTLFGACIYFRRDLVGLVRNGILLALRRLPSGDGDADDAEDGRRTGRLAWLLVASTIPAAAAGAALSDPLDTLAEHEWLIGILLIVFGLVLYAADRLGGDRPVEGFGPRQALAVGAAQALALAPGVSRSGATITAARALGFTRDAAARLSFLMSLPIIAGALVFEGAGLVERGMPAGFGPAFAWGIGASAVTGFLAVWGTLRFIRNNSFFPFVVYRVVVGAAVIGIAASSFR
jgi:undecaprenyl-diphosphatase